ncbi:MAG: hypothetical protein FWE03_07360 [Firmicutes bacterium]|nr:hypothetical protein [Bacillota bacterium]
MAKICTQCGATLSNSRCDYCNAIDNPNNITTPTFNIKPVLQNINKPTPVKKRKNIIIILPIITFVIIIAGSIGLYLILRDTPEIETQLFINSDFAHWISNPPIQERHPQALSPNTTAFAWRVEVRGTIHNQTNTNYSPLIIQISLYRDNNRTNRIGYVIIEKNVPANSEIEISQIIWTNFYPANPDSTFPRTFQFTIL